MHIHEYINIGDSFTDHIRVEVTDTANHLGNKGVMVVSTPVLLKFIENNSAGVFRGRLPAEYSPVGIEVHLHHVGAAPIGGELTLTSTVIEIKRNIISYDFNVEYNGRSICHGTYKQAIVNLQEFLEKNKAIQD